MVDIQVLAEKIATELLTMENGTVGTRLAIMRCVPGEAEKELGGRCKGPIVDTILECLREA